MKRFLMIVLVLAACGDNKLVPDAQMNIRDAPPADALIPEPRAVAVAGDFMSPGTGTVSKLELKDLMIRQNISPGSALGDPALRYYDGKIYIINRFGSNNITILDGGTLALDEQISTGANSNPQDVAVVGNKLYVPAMGTAGVVVITRGSPTLTTIDLSSLDTVGANDGLPDCVSAYAVGTKVYVACGALRNFAADQVGMIGIIDTATDTLVSAIPMNYRNPYGLFERAPTDSVYFGDLLIPTVPSFTNYATGCIERVSTDATPPTSTACGLTNAELGGFANKISVDPDDHLLWIAVGTFDSSFNATGILRGFDLESGTLWPGQVSGSTQLIVDVAACPGGNVVATDQTMNTGGLRVFRDLAERTSSPISIGMPPVVNALVCYHPLTQ